MADTTGLSEATAALRDHFGPQLQAGHDEGLRLMRDALQERLGISRHDADRLVHDLEKGHAIRWMATRESPTLGVDSGTGMTVGWELATPAPVEGGYWQI